jgi:alpha-1,2-mannosyltransferase
VAARVALSFYYQVITDCDQTFNYEEPTHYLLYGRGLQTWEYAPQYALRSYAYVGLHAFLGLISGATWGADKIAVFHRIHALLAIACGLAEIYFVTGIARAFKSSRLAMLTYLCLLLSAGMAHAAPSYLPSTFTMVGLMFAWGAWLRIADSSNDGEERDRKSKWKLTVHLTVCFTVFALVLGWPFAVVAVVPMGLYLLWRPGVLSLIPSAVLSLLLVCGACVAVDHHYYQKLLLAPWNIIAYNAFGVGGGGQGADLYGVEPWSYYSHNLLLNFNLQALAAMAAPVLLVAEIIARWRQAKREALAKGKKDEGDRTSALITAQPGRQPLASPKMIALLAQLYLWFFLMSGRPHKEERFMFVVFPLVSFAAAVSITIFSDLVSGALPLFFKQPTVAVASSGRSAALNGKRISLARALVVIFLLGTAQLSLSRLVALARGYSSPMAAWTFLARELQDHVYSTGQSEVPAGHSWYQKMKTETALEALFFHTKPGLTAVADVVKDSVLPLIGRTGGKKIKKSNKKKDSPPGAVVCVGKEWYRFPSTFFLPERARSHAALPAPRSTARQEHGPVNLLFLKSSFGGQLPQPFLPKSMNGTAIERLHFNDMNAEEATNRYPTATMALDCDYIIDTLLPTSRSSQSGSKYEPYFDSMVTTRTTMKGRQAKRGIRGAQSKGAEEDECLCMKVEDDTLVGPSTVPAGDAATATAASTTAVEWESIWSAPFVHSDTSPRLTRALWIPRYSESKNSYAQYHILKKQPCTCFPQQQDQEQELVEGQKEVKPAA